MYSGMMKVKETPNGKCDLYNIDGKLIYTGEWKDGLRHGKGTSFYEDDTIMYCGEWEDDVPKKKRKITTDN